MNDGTKNRSVTVTPSVNLIRCCADLKIKPLQLNGLKREVLLTDMDSNHE